MSEYQQTWKEIAKDGEPIVSVLEHNGALIIATAHNLYRVKDGKIELLKFLRTGYVE